MKEDVCSAHQGKNSACLIACLLLGLICLSGCNRVTRHEIVTTIFDGVPSYPPPEEFCAEYYVKSKSEADSALSKGTDPGKKAETQTTRHQPYEEKKCDDCHDKTREGGLIVAKNILCFQCHKDFIQGAYVHGPVAVGECLACHEPHSSRFSSLLKADKNQICTMCHQEKRVATALHEKVMGRQMNCTDCHDPHYGKAPYFMK